MNTDTVTSTPYIIQLTKPWTTTVLWVSLAFSCLQALYFPPMTAAGLRSLVTVLVFMSSTVSIVRAFPIVGAVSAAAAAATPVSAAPHFSNDGGTTGRRQARQQQIRSNLRSSPTRGLVTMALPNRLDDDNSTTTVL